MAQNFPEGMTTGTIPASCLSSATSSKTKKNYVTQQPLEVAENRWRFTSEELAKIQEQMDELLVSSNSSSKKSQNVAFVISNEIIRNYCGMLRFLPTQ